MYVTWQIIIAGFLAICGGFSCICVAMGWVIKIVKAAKKPSDDIKTILKNDDKRLKTLEDSVAFMARAISLLLQDDLEILRHLQTSNNTGKMKEQEQKVTQFLTEVKVEGKV